MKDNRKAVVVSAPSGAGKTTLVKCLLRELPALEFSVSAASRKIREGETDGRDYYFITAESFRTLIGEQAFVEWQEVYPGSYYGTLKRELERIWAKNGIPIFDVDVLGGLNLKKYFGASALAIFIQPPDMKTLENRLLNRGTENEKSLGERLSKAEYEIGFAGRFDRIIINDNLEEKCREIVRVVGDFINPSDE